MKHAAIAITFLIAIATAALAMAQAETRSTASGGVTVKVTPKSFSVGGAPWEFVVVLDTHSQDLTDDIAKSASLVGADGARHSPLGWEGAPSGGHHREGVLRFRPIVPVPATIELQLQRPGETAPRAFRWTLTKE